MGSNSVAKGGEILQWDLKELDFIPRYYFFY